MQKHKKLNFELVADAHVVVRNPLHRGDEAKTDLDNVEIMDQATTRHAGEFCKAWLFPEPEIRPYIPITTNLSCLYTFVCRTGSRNIHILEIAITVQR